VLDAVEAQSYARPAERVMIPRVLRAFALGLLLLGMTREASASDGDRPVEPEPSTTEDDHLRLRLMIPMWLPLLAMDSSITSENDESDSVEIDSEVSWVVMGMLEAGSRPIFARVDVFGIGFGNQSVSKNGEPARIAFDSSGFIGRAVAMVELGPWQLGSARRNRFAVAPLAGARYNDVSLDLGEPANVDGSYVWVDPIVGARTELELGAFRFGTHLDFGGFGVSSDVAFWASATVEYLIAEWFSIWIGWQHYQVLFEQSSEGRDDRLRLYLTGPSAGLGLHLF
jgi:hypothetical protein